MTRKTADDNEPLYIQMFSIHGLVRSKHMELGRDADTGGQVKYVVELGQALSRLKGVAGVDLFTRHISDPAVSGDYAVPVEPVNDRFRIVRIRCGGGKYIRKERLWLHLDEFVDKTIRFIRRQGRLPHVVHGHYADAGYVAAQLSGFFGVPFAFTGHSLGRVKEEKLRHDGMRPEEMTRRYRIDHRIAMEEGILRQADLVVASTHQEVEDQYGRYDYGNRPSFKVIPPGLDVDIFYPYYYDLLPDSERDEAALYAQASVLKELNRFFTYPEKPLILALCRPDKRKNIAGLIQAYGGDPALQTMANLAVFAGIRKDISQMEDNERGVLTDMLLLMDKYDLYGKMAIPKRHDFQSEVPELYRIAAARQGVFVNSALTEPFGLTLLEASAVGLPIVATRDGGPRDIMANCESGILVEPTDSKAIAAAIRAIIGDQDAWERYSKNGIMNVRRHYTWTRHAENYLEALQPLVRGERRPDLSPAKPTDAVGLRLTRLEYILVTDIDNTLIGKDNSRLPELVQTLTRHHERIGFAVATGRHLDSAVEILTSHRVPAPDVIIASVGSEIYYGAERQYSNGWQTHIATRWQRERIVAALADFAFLRYQDETSQHPFKVSYDMNPAKDRLSLVHQRLQAQGLRYTLIYSHDQYLDILPYRASKGKAIRYLSYKWEIPLSHFLVCGDSGNDEEMLRGEPLAVVVGNHSRELDRLRGARRIYFAPSPCAGGILEGIRKFDFITKAGYEVQ